LDNFSQYEQGHAVFPILISGIRGIIGVGIFTNQVSFQLPNQPHQIIDEIISVCSYFQWSI